MLNAVKREYELHPIALLPDRAYSPASIGKAYLRAMGIVEPMRKFKDIPPKIHGIAMAAYYGGRAECRIRRWPVPVVPVDLTSEYVQHPEIKSLGPDGGKCKDHTRGLLRRMTINGGLQHCIGKEVSRFEQGKDDFIENIDDVCIHYDGGRVAANESLVAEINARGLRKTTKETGLDRKTIRAVINGKKVKASTLAKVVIGLRPRQD